MDNSIIPRAAEGFVVLPSQHLRVLTAWKLNHDSTKAVLLLSAGSSCRTEFLDMRDIILWLSENYPDALLQADDGSTGVNFTIIGSEVLALCLAYARVSGVERIKLSEVAARSLLNAPGRYLRV